MHPLAFALALAAAPPEAKPIIFVDTLSAGAAQAEEAKSLTTSLCTALEKTKKLDVACAPELKDILGFAATVGLMGSEQTTSSKVERRLEQVKYVVNGTLRKDGKAYVLVLSASEKGPESAGVVVVAGKKLWSVETRADNAAALLPQIDAQSAKIGDVLTTPAAPAAAPAKK